MVNTKDITEIKKLLESFEFEIRRLEMLTQLKWKLEIYIPQTKETISRTISDIKKQEIIQEAINRRDTLKAKINSIDWNSLN